VIFGKFGYPIDDLEACQDLLFIVYTAYVTALDLSWSSRSQTLSSMEWSGFKSKSSPVQSNEITGYKHIFLDKLKGLILIKEKLIALNSYYGFITKYSILKS